MTVEVVECSNGVRSDGGVLAMSGQWQWCLISVSAVDVSDVLLLLLLLVTGRCWAAQCQLGWTAVADALR